MTRALNEEQRTALLAQHPDGTAGRPARISPRRFCFWLAPAGYITGETLHVNGGMYMA